MRTFITRLALIATALVALWLAVIPGQALAMHVSCGDTITQDTTLDSDLLDCPYDGIIIGADNIRLDLNGHTIDGNSKLHICCFAGVKNDSGFDGVEVANGTIQEINGDGIRARNTANSAIRDLTLQSNSGFGIRLFASKDNRIERNVVVDDMVLTGPSDERGLCTTLESVRNRIEGNSVSQGGITVGCSSDTLVRGNDLTHNEYAAIVVGGVNNRVEKNRVVDNPVFGILIEGIARNNLVEQNIVNGSYIGIVLAPGLRYPEEQPRDNRITKNFVRDNRSIGILVERSAANLIEHNVVSHNGSVEYAIGSGLLIAGNPARGELADGNKVLKNFAYDNHGHGLFLSGGDNTLVEGNKAYRNTDDGIHVDDEGINTITANSANQNGDLGIEAGPAVIDGGGNKATGNGNPLQCLNIFCK